MTNGKDAQVIRDTVQRVKNNVSRRFYRRNPRIGGVGGISSDRLSSMILDNFKSIFKIAYCKNDAGEGNEITCYLDAYETGDEVSVECLMCGTSDLNTAFPRLAEAVPIMVWFDVDTWRSVMTFQASEDC
jgi:hypothetical protein